jgi:Domain of unknown function (DUF4845)
MLKQRGLTLSGFLTWAIIIAFAALIGFKLAPAYVEDMTIQKHFKAIARDSTFADGVRGPIEAAFSKRADIDRIDGIGPKDIIISKVSGGIVLSATYTKCVPMVYNVRACMDFNPSSK